MIQKIVSGGQTGAERAALDVAVKLGIPYGGWVSKVRPIRDGSLSEYKLQEMSTAGYSKIIEKNVTDSDGTLIIAQGKLNAESDYAREMTLKHRKQLLGISLRITNHQEAAALIASWIFLQRIRFLNVTGPKASEDPQIYGHVTVILESVFNLEAARNEKPVLTYDVLKTGRSRRVKKPETVNDAVDAVIEELSLKDKHNIAKMGRDDLTDLHSSLGVSIRNDFFYPGNEKLLGSCRQEAVDKSLHRDQASMVIIEKLWERLQKSHKLRVLK